MLFGAAETAASPPAITTELADRNAAAPPVTGGATKVTTPPSTGSTGLLAVRITASGYTNAAPMADDCGVLPAMGVRVKPWLSKAPISTTPSTMRGRPRWSVVTPGGIIASPPASIAGLPGSRGIVSVGPP